MRQETGNKQRAAADVKIIWDMTDVTYAPWWVRFLLAYKKPITVDMTGWHYRVTYKTLFGKPYFIRAWVVFHTPMVSIKKQETADHDAP